MSKDFTILPSGSKVASLLLPPFCSLGKDFSKCDLRPIMCVQMSLKRKFSPALNVKQLWIFILFTVPVTHSVAQLLGWPVAVHSAFLLRWCPIHSCPLFDH